MPMLPALAHALQSAVERVEPSVPRDAASDLKLAFALTQLLIDSGRVDAAGSVIIASWRTPSAVFFEVLCAERVRPSLAVLLARMLSRPFRAADQTWLLSELEASELIGLTARKRA